MGKKSNDDNADLRQSVITDDGVVGISEVINASGHKQELDRQFSLLSICAVGICTGNAWAALGGSIVSLFYFSLIS